MRKLIESTHVSLGGEIGSPHEWAAAYLNDEHMQYATELLFSADALLLGRRTYEGLSTAYPSMDRSEFVNRMNNIPKYVASTTIKKAIWNATIIQGDVGTFVSDLKLQPGHNIVKYGNGTLDDILLTHNLIDEYHFLLTPAAVGRGQHLFEDVQTPPHLTLVDVKRFTNGVVLLVYTPK
jgi:dihydrofolate reductase